MCIGNQPFPCESQPRRVSCRLVDSSKIRIILTNVAQNRRTQSKQILVSLHFTEELETLLHQLWFRM
jgi:hypothetical protein